MIYLNAYSETVICDKAIKGKDFIIIFLNDSSIGGYHNISDFSHYSLIDEDGNPVDFTEVEANNSMDTAIRAVVMAMAENGALSGSFESIVNRAIEIANE